MGLSLFAQVQILATARFFLNEADKDVKDGCRQALLDYRDKESTRSRGSIICAQKECEAFNSVRAKLESMTRDDLQTLLNIQPDDESDGGTSDGDGGEQISEAAAQMTSDSGPIESERDAGRVIIALFRTHINRWLQDVDGLASEIRQMNWQSALTPTPATAQGSTPASPLEPDADPSLTQKASCSTRRRFTIAKFNLKGCQNALITFQAFLKKEINVSTPTEYDRSNVLFEAQALASYLPTDGAHDRLPFVQDCDRSKQPLLTAGAPFRCKSLVASPLASPSASATARSDAPGSPRSTASRSEVSSVSELELDSKHDTIFLSPVESGFPADGKEVLGKEGAAGKSKGQQQQGSSESDTDSDCTPM